MWWTLWQGGVSVLEGVGLSAHARSRRDVLEPSAWGRGGRERACCWTYWMRCKIRTLPLWMSNISKVSNEILGDFLRSTMGSPRRFFLWVKVKCVMETLNSCPTRETETGGSLGVVFRGGQPKNKTLGNNRIGGCLGDSQSRGDPCHGLTPKS